MGAIDRRFFLKGAGALGAAIASDPLLANAVPSFHEPVAHLELAFHQWNTEGPYMTPDGTALTNSVSVFQTGDIGWAAAGLSSAPGNEFIAEMGLFSEGSNRDCIALPPAGLSLINCIIEEPSSVAAALATARFAQQSGSHPVMLIAEAKGAAPGTRLTNELLVVSDAALMFSQEEIISVAGPGYPEKREFMNRGDYLVGVTSALSRFGDPRNMGGADARDIMRVLQFGGRARVRECDLREGSSAGSDVLSQFRDAMPDIESARGCLILLDPMDHRAQPGPVTVLGSVMDELERLGIESVVAISPPNWICSKVTAILTGLPHTHSTAGRG